MTSNKTLQDLVSRREANALHMYSGNSQFLLFKFNSYDPALIASHPGIRSDLFKRPLDRVKVTDFFGNVQNIELTRQQYPLAEGFEVRQQVSISIDACITAYSTKFIGKNENISIEDQSAYTNVSKESEPQRRTFNVRRVNGLDHWLQSSFFSPASLAGAAIILGICYAISSALKA